MASGDASIEEEDDEPFEISDYTNATPWEELTANIETILRNWSLFDCTVGPWNRRSIIKSGQLQARVSHLQYNGRPFKLSWFHPEFQPQEEYLPQCDSSNHLNPLTVSEQTKFSTEKLSIPWKASFEHVPFALCSMLDESYDFFQRSHQLERWFGLHEFLLLSPTDDRSEFLGSMDPNEAKQILSAFSVALQTSKCAIPAFVPVHEPSRGSFIGVCVGGLHGGLISKFESDILLRYPPPELQYLDGLLQLFKQKIAENTGTHHMQRSALITARLTWMKNYDTQGRISPRAQTKYWTNQIWGPQDDPIRKVSVSAIWPSFSEGVYIDSTIFTSLKPRRSPIITIKALSRLYTMSSDPQITSADVHTKLGNRVNALHSILREICEMPEDIMVADLAPKIVSDHDDSPHIASRVPTTRAAKQLGSVFYAITDSFRTSLSPQRAKEIINEVISNDEWSDQFKNSNDLEESDAIIRKMAVKGSKKGSLLMKLSKFLADCGNISSMAVLWIEFCRKLRYHWDNALLLPFFPSKLCTPDFSHCLIEQKLCLLQYCIHKRRQLWDSHKISQSAIPESISIHQVKVEGIAGEAWNLEDESKSRTSDDSESEYYDTRVDPEENENPSEKDRCRLNPLGMLGLRSKMDLFEPVIQEIGPVTEDMIQEQQDLLTRIGSSEEASKIRQRLMSSSLESDMMAFKAANPDCCLEDFVRWHSPRDWDESTQQLSLRMGPTSLWAKLWESSPAMPVSMQRSIFDHTTEAEKALHYLETISSSTLVSQIVSVYHQFVLITLFHAVDDICQTMFGSFDRKETEVNHAISLLCRLMQRHIDELSSCIKNAHRNSSLQQSISEKIILSESTSLDLQQILSAVYHTESFVSIVLSIALKLEDPYLCAMLLTHYDIDESTDPQEHLFHNVSQKKSIADSLIQSTSLFTNTPYSFCAELSQDEDELRDKLMDFLRVVEQQDETSSEMSSSNSGNLKKQSIAEADAKEFIIRYVCDAPFIKRKEAIEGSKIDHATVHRMYSLIASQELRVSVAISDSEF